MIATLPALNRLAVQTDLLDLVGNTPLIPLRRVLSARPGVELYAKAEWFNPSGSVKDRPAREIVLEAEQSGDLREGVRLIDATSGNMGIAYATLCAARGYEVELAIPANASPERIAILRVLGASLILTDPMDGTDGAQLEAKRRYAENHGRYFYADQYNNPANWQAHYRTTGVEIWEQTDGRVTHFVAGLGTSGTMMGVGRRLREFNPDVKLISMQPDSPLHGLEGLKHMPTALRPGIYDEALADENLEIATEDAFAMARQLAREEGLFVGVSAAAAVVAAMRVAASLREGVVVTILPDAGFKYANERFWKDE